MIVIQTILIFLAIGVVALLSICGILALIKGILKMAIQFIYDLKPEKKDRKEDKR